MLVVLILSVLGSVFVECNKNFHHKREHKINRDRHHQDDHRDTKLVHIVSEFILKSRLLKQISHDVLH